MKYELDYPVAFHTVDMAIVRVHEGRFQLLLIQKKKEVEAGLKVWRFPGGFVDPADASAEAAALREGKEETHMEFNSELLYIGSSKVDDDRYRNSDHKVITSFFRLNWKSGEDGLGFDDVASTKWFDIDQISDEIKNPVHTPLFEMFFEKFKAYLDYNKVHRTANDFAGKMDEHFTKLAKSVEEGVNNIAKDASKLFQEFFKD